MTSSIITKKIIAKSLKELMATEPFQKISVSDIMVNCKMRRQTFYYHFQDKYELLGWIYKEETKENITDFIGYEKWENIFHLLLEYFSQNRQFYQNAFKVEEQNSFNEYLYEYTKNLYSEIMTKYLDGSGLMISNERKELMASFYSYGFVGIIKEWIEKDCLLESSTISSLMKYMINDQLLLFLRE